MIALPLPLTSARLILRLLTPEDETALAEAANDAALAAMMARMPHPFTRTDARHFIAARLAPGKDGLTLAIALRDGGDFAGCIGISRGGNGLPHMGYWLGQRWQNQGLGSEAATAFVAALDKTGDCRRIGAISRKDNARSSRLLERCGFQVTESLELDFRTAGRQRCLLFIRNTTLAPASQRQA